jgi:putative DNA primase/helicase
MTRRVLVGRIDPGVERPELVHHPFRPIALAHRARPLLVRCVLAIVMAHRQSGQRRNDPLGSFEEWSYLVRDALTWLGEDDPCDVMENTRSADPKLEQLRSIIHAWREAFEDAQVRVKDIMTAIHMTRTAEHESWTCASPDLRDAVTPIAKTSRGDISPTLIAGWLRQNLDRTITIDGVKYKFSNEPSTNGAKWRLEFDDPRPADPLFADEDTPPF